MPTNSCSKNFFLAFRCSASVRPSASMGGRGLTALCTSCFRHPMHSVPWPFGQMRLGSSSSRPPLPPLLAAAAASAMARRDSTTPSWVSRSSRISSHFSEASKKRRSASARALAWASTFSFSANRFASMASLELPASLRMNSSSSKSSSRSNWTVSRFSLATFSCSSMSSNFAGHSASRAWASSSSCCVCARVFSATLQGCEATQQPKACAWKPGLVSLLSARLSSLCPAAIRRSRSRAVVPLRSTTRSRSSEYCSESSETSRRRLFSVSSSSRMTRSFCVKAFQKRSTVAPCRSRSLAWCWSA
mmetsp:Transcript_7695/g.20725  ORF Transcript_7695/g.20725 Transcript_7695/m.20725 type:complete len:304 (-) Transcript_7695:778-1689(-)